MITILVVDDQETVTYSLKRLLQLEGYQVLIAGDGLSAIHLVKSTPLDLVIMDVKMPGMDGLEALAEIKSAEPQLPIIMMTAYSSIDKAIEATKLGAFDYLAKPFDNNELLARVKEGLKTRDMVTKAISFEEAGNSDVEQVIGKSPLMLAVYKQVGKVAHTDATVLIKGESGTGKELIARAIVHHSNRSGKPFLAINSAAIPEQLLESELFGYERGAFTGADAKKTGKFEQCFGGTIFLDEIGDMPVGLQAKLLRILQDGRFERLGGSETIKNDVRIIAASNKNLEDMVHNGEFREDLYYRLNVVSIELPPLRERLEDIDDLAGYFISRFNKKFSRNIKGITSEALIHLKNHSWPGNVRELANIIQKAVVFCNSDYLSPQCCGNLEKFNVDVSSTMELAVQHLVDLMFDNDYQGRFQEVNSLLERAMIRKALDVTGGNQVKSARMLGVSRNTLRKKLFQDRNE